MTAKEAADRFWTHALSIYGQDDARKAFLRLQDRDGADVPMLLWCLWCGAEGRSVQRETMAEAVMFSKGWQQKVVIPLRNLRRTIKEGVTDSPHKLSENARSLIAQTEQEVERLQMNHLAALPTHSSPDAANKNLALYADIAGLDPEQGDIVLIQKIHPIS